MEDKGKPTAREQAQSAFKQSVKAANRGDSREADRWLKTAEKMSAAAARIAALPEPEVIDDEATRAELRARIGRFVGVAHVIQDWEHRRDIRDAVAAFARQHNLPEPPQIEPCPYSDGDLEAIGAGKSTLVADPKHAPAPRKPAPIPHETRRMLGLPVEEFEDDPLTQSFQTRFAAPE